jgi:hypothetical protein
MGWRSKSFAVEETLDCPGFDLRIGVKNHPKRMCYLSIGYQ